MHWGADNAHSDINQRNFTEGELPISGCLAPQLSRFAPRTQPLANVE